MIGRQEPLLLLAEDLHWADPTTLEFLGLALERVRNDRILALLTFRPEFAPPWPLQPHLTLLTLNHLSSAECERLARRVVQAGALSEEIIANIVERADGIPLFVEELTSSVLEAARDVTDSAAVPETLRDALMARLDRLGPAKSTAQLAAVIGRQFPLDWLSAAARQPEDVGAALDTLLGLGSGLWSRFCTLGPTTSSSMPWYGTLPTTRCCVRSDSVFMAMWPRSWPTPSGTSMLRPESSRFTSSRPVRGERALPFLMEAASLASSRGVHEEALSHYEAALEILDESGEHSPRLLDALMGKAAALHFLGRREEAAELLVEREPALSQVEDVARHGRYLHWLGQIQAFLGRREEARSCLHRARSLAEEANDEMLEADVLFALGLDDYFRGDLLVSIASYERAIEILKRHGDTYSYGMTLVYAGITYGFLGRYRDARRAGEEGLAIAGRLSDPVIEANAYAVLGLYYGGVGEYQRANRPADAGHTRCPQPLRRSTTLLRLGEQRRACRAEIASH